MDKSEFISVMNGLHCDLTECPDPKTLKELPSSGRVFRPEDGHSLVSQTRNIFGDKVASGILLSSFSTVRNIKKYAK